MLEQDGCMEIQILHGLGMGIRAIARELGVSVNTVRKYVQHEGCVAYGPRVPMVCKLHDYVAYLQDRVIAAKPDWIPATVLQREIAALGYAGGLSQLRTYLRTLKPVVKADPVVRFETAPGRQMQMDWIEFRRNPKLAAFVATLGHSRRSYVEYVNNERIETLLSCHEHAFTYFDGVVEEVLYDNMKTVVLTRDQYGPGQHRFHSTFWDFARHYGVRPRLCKPYRARTKGKVERFNHYLRHSFFVPFASKLKQAGVQVDVANANVAVWQWLDQIANVRLHATTQQVPQEVWQTTERQSLRALPPAYRGEIRGIKPAQLDPVAHNATYPVPVPPQHALQGYDALLEVTV